MVYVFSFNFFLKAKHFRFEFVRTTDRYLIIKRTNSLKDLSQRKEEKREEGVTREDEEGKKEEVEEGRREDSGRRREKEGGKREEERGRTKEDEGGRKSSGGGEKRMHHLSKDDTTKDEFYGITSGTDEEENEKIDEIKSSSIGESMNNFHGGKLSYPYIIYFFIDKVQQHSMKEVK